MLDPLIHLLIWGFVSPLGKTSLCFDGGDFETAKKSSVIGGWKSYRYAATLLRWLCCHLGCTRVRMLTLKNPTEAMFECANSVQLTLFAYIPLDSSGVSADQVNSVDPIPSRFVGAEMFCYTWCSLHARPAR